MMGIRIKERRIIPSVSAVRMGENMGWENPRWRCDFGVSTICVSVFDDLAGERMEGRAAYDFIWLVPLWGADSGGCPDVDDDFVGDSLLSLFVPENGHVPDVGRPCGILCGFGDDQCL